MSSSLALVAGIRAATASRRIPLQLEMQRTVAESQIQLLLSALLRLPVVREVQYRTKEQMFAGLQEAHPEQVPFLASFVPENPLQNRVVLTLRSLHDLPLLQRFLERQALQSVLAPTFPWALAAWEDAVGSDVVQFRMLQRIFLALSVVSLLGMVLLLFVAARAMKRALPEAQRLPLLLGASPSFSLRPLVLELGVLTVAAGALAFFLSWGALRFFSSLF